MKHIQVYPTPFNDCRDLVSIDGEIFSLTSNAALNLVHIFSTDLSIHVG